MNYETFKKACELDTEMHKLKCSISQMKNMSGIYGLNQDGFQCYVNCAISDLTFKLMKVEKEFESLA